MKETKKTWGFRNHLGDFQRFLHGKGIDIGCGDDLLKTRTGEVTAWDLPQGDAAYMASVPDNHFDFAYSSHCLEHISDINIALSNWIRITKPYGFIYIVVPDYKLYEKCVWPSRYNTDHKCSFSLHMTREEVGRDNHYHIYHDLFPLVQERTMLVETRLEDENYNYSLPDNIDQTHHGNAICQICVILQKLL